MCNHHNFFFLTAYCYTPRDSPLPSTYKLIFLLVFIHSVWSLNSNKHLKKKPSITSPRHLGLVTVFQKQLVNMKTSRNFFSYILYHQLPNYAIKVRQWKQPTDDLSKQVHKQHILLPIILTSFKNVHKNKLGNVPDQS